MKKILFLAAFLLAIGSYGGHIDSAHAQTMTSTTMSDTSTAALQQQLDVAKATLANLEIQAGIVPAGDGGSMGTVPQPVGTNQPLTNGLTSAEVNQFNGILGSLATTLGQLNSSLAANSSSMTTADQQAVASTLNGMQNVLATMVSQINTDVAANTVPSNSAPVAVAPTTNPSTGVAQAAPTTPSVAAGTTATSSPVVVTTTTSPIVVGQTAPSTATDQPQTAQASSFWSFTKSHWPTIAIILLILAILVILFWPEKETVATISTSKQTHSTTTVTHAVNGAPIASSSTSTTTTQQSQTPVSTVVGGSSHPSQPSN